MANILEGLMQEIGPGGLEAIAGKLGVGSGQAQGALQSALPLIVGALARNTNTPDGAQSLQNAVQQHAGGNPLDQLSQAVGQSGVSGDSSAILGHIFGSRGDVAAEGVAQTSELDSNQAGSLLGMLAPLVLGYLGRKSGQEQLGAGGLASALGQEAQTMEQDSGIGGLLGAVLDRDGGGLGLSDLMSAGSSIFGAFRK